MVLAWGEKVVGVVPVVMPASTSQEMAVLAKLVVGTSVKFCCPAGAGSPALRWRKTAIWARVVLAWGVKVVGVVPVVMPASTSHAMAVLAKLVVGTSENPCGAGEKHDAFPTPCSAAGAPGAAPAGTPSCMVAIPRSSAIDIQMRDRPSFMRGSSRRRERDLPHRVMSNRIR
nr:hypothetical protein [Candidatus Microthrix sp.]